MGRPKKYQQKIEKVEVPDEEEIELPSPPEYPSVPAEIEPEDNTIAPRRVWWMVWKKTAKPYIYAKMVLPNKRIITKPVWIQPIYSFKFKGGSYSINREAIYTERVSDNWRPVSYYFFEYPDPIIFRHKETYNIETARTFDKLLDCKVTQDSVSTPEGVLLYIILACSIIAVLVLLFIAWKVFTKKVGM